MKTKTRIVDGISIVKMLKELEEKEKLRKEYLMQRIGRAFKGALKSKNNFQKI